MRNLPPRRLVMSAAVLCTAALFFPACSRKAEPPTTVRRGAAVRPASLVESTEDTGRDALSRIVETSASRLAKDSSDTAAAVRLANASMRLMRVTGNTGYVQRAETALNKVLSARPDDYDAKKMLAAVYASQHRFKDAIRIADVLRAARPIDAWNYGVLGDAHLELGEYDAAFDAFDQMAAVRPNAASYGRASYARELQGDLPGALKLMKMAAEATTPQDAESLAWHYAQIAHIYLQMGQLDDAAREYARSEYAFPGHPFAREGSARVRALSGDYAGALQLMRPVLTDAPTPSDLAFAGDLFAALGQADQAERHFQLAEAAWRSDVPEPTRLAKFLAERGRHLDQAVTIAQQAATARRDIFTMDALAWSCYQTKQTACAKSAIAEALRTGTRDAAIRYHAAVINSAADAAARQRAWSVFRP